MTITMIIIMIGTIFFHLPLLLLLLFFFKFEELEEKTTIYLISIKINLVDIQIFIHTFKNQ